MFGSHLSISGGLHNALIACRELTMDCVQVFTKNQRQWSSKPLTDEEIRLWRRHRDETKVEHVVSHDSYLINLASPSSDMLGKSMALFRDELLRCEALAIPSLVTHPGSHMGEGEEAGLARVAASLNQIHGELPGLKTITCLEITAGQGTGLGYRFEHLKRIIELTHEPERLAVCLDTAHLLEAGYDLTSGAGGAATLQECDGVLGVALVRAVHVNDSKTPRGSRVDRHEHIGKGHVHAEAFRVFVNHKLLRNVPKILETPKEHPPEGQSWDAINLEAIRGLVDTGRPAVGKIKKTVRKA